MNALLARLFSFPLLGKELTEAAARRRTYVTRVAYAVLLFVFFALTAPNWMWRADYNPIYAMGAGRQIFENILMLQFCGIALFLPALMSGRITQEKERDSLALLFLTELRPWSIVLQKYLGGLVPALSFLLLAMPLGAIAYAFGGVPADYLLAGIYCLLLAALQIGAFSLMFSAWCRTTVAAYLGTYIFGVLFYAGPLLLVALFRLATRRSLGPSPPDEIFLLIPPALLDFSRSKGAAYLFLHSLPILISTAIFLLLARVFLVRRAFLPAGNLFLALFRQLDGVMKRANRLAGNVTVLRDTRTLPDDDPIAWREMTRKALGKTHYLVRILVCLEIPTIILCVLASLEINQYSGQCGLLTAFVAVLGALALVALSVQASNTLVSERVNQTLEVLLTTPLTAREIVEQKARVLRRFMLVLAVPLLTICAWECWLEKGMGQGQRRDGSLVYLVCAVLSVVIYLPLVSWLSLWIGLKMRTRFKAIITALAVIVAWCVVPVVVIVCTMNVMGYSSGRRELIEALILFSPIAAVAMNEFAQLHDFAGINSPTGAWVCVIVNFHFYAGCLRLFRHLALTRADRYLRR